MRLGISSSLEHSSPAEWAEKHTVQLDFIQLGKPTQNAFIEHFNRTYRIEILDLYLFRTLNEVRKITEQWLPEYGSVFKVLIPVIAGNIPAQ